VLFALSFGWRVEREVFDTIRRDANKRIILYYTCSGNPRGKRNDYTATSDAGKRLRCVHTHPRPTRTYNIKKLRIYPNFPNTRGRYRLLTDDQGDKESGVKHSKFESDEINVYRSKTVNSIRSNNRFQKNRISHIRSVFDILQINVTLLRSN